MSDAAFASVEDLQLDHFTLLRIAGALERRCGALLRPSAPASPVAADVDDRTRRLRELTRARRLRDATVRLWRRARRLERRAVATGRILDEPNDRAFAQSAIDVWSLRQAQLMRSARDLAARIALERADLDGTPLPRRRARRGERPLPVRRTLAAFDPANAPDFTDDQSPFFGLAVLTEGAAAAAMFQTRRDNVADLLALVTDRRVVVVHGLPGSGDGALVAAGLVPALRGSPVGSGWTIWPTMVPGTDPVAALLQSVAPPGQPPARWVAANRAFVEATPAKFADVAARAGAADVPSLLVVDQAEELLVGLVDAEGMRRVTEAIAALATAASPQHRIVLIARASFAERLLALPPLAAILPDAIGRFHPRPLCSDELVLAIEGPARTIGLRLEPGVVGALVRSVSNDPAALPLLEVALAELWRRRVRNVIPLAALEAIGSPNEVLARLAEATFARVEAQAAIVRAAMLTLVVPLVGDDYVRRRIRRESLHRIGEAADVDRVLDAFVGAGLLRRIDGVDRGDDRFDVRHEALIRVWPRLADWLARERDANARRLAVLNRARMWRDANQAEDQLAIGGALEEAASVAGDDPLIASYVAASRSAAKARVRRHRYALGIVALLGVVVVAMAWAAIHSYRRATALDSDFVNASTMINTATERVERSAQTALQAQQGERQAQAFTQELLAQSADAPVAVEAPETRGTEGPGLRGVIWIGSGGTPLLRERDSATLVTHLNVRTGGAYRLRAPIKLRASAPSPEVQSPAIVGSAPAGWLVVAMGVPVVNPRPSGPQYFLPVRLVPRVFLQAPPGSEGPARQAIDAMRAAGYETLPVQILAAARGKAEVRYIFRQDAEPATALADLLTRHLRTRDPARGAVRTTYMPELQGSGRPGVLEAWIDASERRAPPD